VQGLRRPRASYNCFLEDMVSDWQAHDEKCQRDNPLNDPVKRKAYGDTLNLPNIPHRFGSPAEDKDETESAGASKKRKTSHHKPEENTNNNTSSLRLRHKQYFKDQAHSSFPITPRQRPRRQAPNLPDLGSRV
jgi:hypothetical protein